MAAKLIHLRSIRLMNNAGINFPLCYSRARLLDLDKSGLPTSGKWGEVTCERCKAEARRDPGMYTIPVKAAAPDDWFNVEVSRCTDAAFAKLMRGWDGAELYLYFRRGELRMAADLPGPEWQLGAGEPERGARTRDQLRAWIYRVARGLACLPEEG